VVFLQRGSLTGLRFILAEPETGRHANAAFFEVELDTYRREIYFLASLQRHQPAGIKHMKHSFAVGQTVKTRRGESVRIICVDRVSEIGANIVGLINRGTMDFILCWQGTGRHRFDAECPDDLMEPDATSA